MKKIRSLFLLGLLLTALATVAQAAPLSLAVKNPGGQYETKTVQTVGLTCDGNLLQADVPAFLLDNRTMVPVRVIAEQLGAAVTWKQDSQQVQIESGQSSITLTIGSASATVNGQSVPMYNDVPATMVALGSLTRTMVPLKFVSDCLGVEVAWDGAAHTAAISTVTAKTSQISEPLLTGNAITVSVNGEAQPKIFTLPGRVVADFPGGVLTGSGFGSIAVNGTALKSVRYNQYDSGYDTPRVVRIVFDLQAGCTEEMLSIDFSEGVLTMMQPEIAPLPPQEPLPDVPLAPLIVLDAGHGGTDTGAPSFGVNEKDVTHAITQMVGTLLEQANYRVAYTRTEDVTVSLADRAELANAMEADIFVCIHANAFPQNPQVNGLETYYLVGGTHAKRLAADIQAAVLQAAGPADRGIRTANFYVLRNTLMPAVLVETGYLTNEAECQKLISPEYQQLVAQGIAQGIEVYLGNL